MPRQAPEAPVDPNVFEVSIANPTLADDDGLLDDWADSEADAHFGPFTIPNGPRRLQAIIGNFWQGGGINCHADDAYGNFFETPFNEGEGGTFVISQPFAVLHLITKGQTGAGDVADIGWTDDISILRDPVPEGSTIASATVVVSGDPTVYDIDVDEYGVPDMTPAGGWDNTKTFTFTVTIA